MIFSKQTVRDVSVQGKVVLVRADYNVPLTDDGEISDDLRIRASLETLQYLLQQNCKVVVISHLGRPGGQPNRKYTLLPVAKRLSDLLGVGIKFIDDCIGKKVHEAVQNLAPGQLLLLENVRFYPGEEENNYEFARELAEATGARYFVQDGFGVVHREHATTSAITHFIPSVAGLLLEKEITALSESTDGMKHPLVAILGGAKVSDKISVIKKFVKIADKILVGGAMANTFLAYRGVDMGASKIEDGQHQVLDEIYSAAVDKVGVDNVDDFIVLPVDLAVSTTPKAVRRKSVPLYAIDEHESAFDIGDATAAKFCNELEDAELVIWNGTLGFAENQTFAYGSAVLAKCITSKSKLTSIIGGGDTADFALKWCKKNNAKFSHISTGGGASLDFIAGRKLPGVEALLVSKK